jgi:hypothetical protein
MKSIVLPIHVAERLFEGACRPQAGQHVQGTRQLQAPLAAQVEDHGAPFVVR